MRTTYEFKDLRLAGVAFAITLVSFGSMVVLARLIPDVPPRIFSLRAQFTLPLLLERVLASVACVGMLLSATFIGRVLARIGKAGWAALTGAAAAGFAVVSAFVSAMLWGVSSNDETNGSKTLEAVSSVAGYSTIAAATVAVFALIGWGAANLRHDAQAEVVPHK